MMLSTRLFTFLFSLVFILSTSEFADARTIQKKGRNYFESSKRANSETAHTYDFNTLETSLTLRLLDQMKAGIYAQLLKRGALTQRLVSRQRINF